MELIYFATLIRRMRKNSRDVRGGHTMNIIVVCDFDLHLITFASLGWEGSMHDYKIFRECVYGRGKNKFLHPPKGNVVVVGI